MECAMFGADSDDRREVATEEEVQNCRTRGADGRMEEWSVGRGIGRRMNAFDATMLVGLTRC
jgi:hypothetical protein